jgi:hypothetical protein
MMQEKQKCWNTKEGNGGIALASPPAGLNNNLEFMGKHLHVQTESTGFPTARIVTQVFCRGRVVLSKKSEYPPGISEFHDFNKMQQLMRTQHYQVIQEIADKQRQILGTR